MISVAVLCPGPSLAQWHSSSVLDRHDLLIGVNRAVHHSPCDWWCFCDGRIYQQYKPADVPRIFTTAIAVEGVPEIGQHRPLMWRSLMVEYPQYLGWDTFSSTAALVLACYIGADEVVVYGCDWAPLAPDFDGLQSSPDGRSAERFIHEAALWAHVREFLEAKRHIKILRKNVEVLR